MPEGSSDPSSAQHVAAGRAPWVGLTGGVCLVTLALILATFRDYGVTYDESWHATYGDHIIRWYSSGFRDDGALTYWNLYYYGGLFDLVAQLTVRVSPLGMFETRHLLVALFGLAGVIGAYKAGSYLAGPAAGFWSALILLLTPRYYGDIFNNNKDVVFAVLFLYSLYYLIRSVRHWPVVPWGLAVKLGIAIGLMLGTRVAGVLVFGYWGVALGSWLLSRWRRRGPHQGAGRALAPLAQLAFRGLVTGAIAYGVMLLFWPAAQADPLGAPMRALRFTTNFDEGVEVLFDGRQIKSTNLPWYYVMRWFAVTLPEFYLLGLVAGLAGVATRAPRSWSGWVADDARRLLEVMVLVIAVAFPFAYTAASAPATYDGVRHFLFVIPPMAILAGVGVSRLTSWVGRRDLKVAMMVLLAGCMAVTVYDMWQLHPYQYVYFNRLVAGGLPGASKLFDTDYWGASYKEGVQWLVKNYEPPAARGKPKVASCLFSTSTSYFLPADRFKYVGSYHDGEILSKEPDLLLATTRWGCDKIRQGRTIHVVERQGVPLLYVIEVNHNDGSAFPAKVPE
jgi:hypothetical protein